MVGYHHTIALKKEKRGVSKPAVPNAPTRGNMKQHGPTLPFFRVVFVIVHCFRVKRPEGPNWSVVEKQLGDNTPLNYHSIIYPIYAQSANRFFVAVGVLFAARLGRVYNNC